MPRLLLLIFILLPFLSANAQENPDFPLPPLEPITAENADRLAQVGRLGNGVVREMAWSPDGSTLAIATSLGVWVHDADHPDDPPVLLEMDAGASSVAASNTLIATGSDDGTVHVWDIGTREQRAVLEGHLYYVGSITFSADGSLLASGDNSGIVRLWDALELREVRTFQSVGGIADIAFSLDKEFLAAGSDEKIAAWTVSDASIVAEWNMSERFQQSTVHVAFSPDNAELVIFVYKPSVSTAFWTLNLETEEAPEAHEVDFAISDLLTTSDQVAYLTSTNAASYFADGTIIAPILHPDVLTFSNDAAINTDQTIIAFHRDFQRDAEIRTYNLETNEEHTVLGYFFSHPTAVIRVSGHRLLAIYSSYPAHLWNLDSREVIRTFSDLLAPNFGTTIDRLVLNGDGSLLAQSDNSGTVTLFDTTTMEQRARLHGHIRAVNGVAFSPDGRLIASGSLDRTIQIWDVETALANPDTPALVRLEGHTSGVTSVTFNGDGTLLASASYDGTIRLWGVPQED